MSNILVDYIRVSGFRGLKDFQMPMKRTTVLTGVNNVGKTSVLKALQIAFGSRTFLENDDLCISAEGQCSKIIVDVRIISVDDNDTKLAEFSADWEGIFKTDKIKFDDTEFAYVPLRTTVTYDQILSRFNTESSILSDWDPAAGHNWIDIISKKHPFVVNEIPFFYEEAQRDIVEDLKLKTSFVGKMLSNITKSYDEGDVIALEELIAELNENAVDKSSVLKTIKTSLLGVASAMGVADEKIELTPFSKKIRDLNKAISIQYGAGDNIYAMDYHGMGTRSWASLLTLKAFVAHNETLSNVEDKKFFPIIAIEEPEAHLHPNAQKKLYKQISSIAGQKIISTHSQHIAASADICEVVGLYKTGDVVSYGSILANSLDNEDLRKLKQKVIKTRGEIFFSRALVFFEGETEEQALPIIAAKYFDCDPSELGIDFISVGGAGQYLPFLRFAESFNIPWYIFSDGEVDPVSKMTKSVKVVRGESFVRIAEESNVFIIPNNGDFEKYMCTTHFKDILELYKNKELSRCTDDRQREVEKMKLNNLTDVDILSKAKTHKTQWALIFAEAIITSENEMPELLRNLFVKIKEDLGYE